MSQTRTDFGRKIALPEPPPGPSPHLLARAARGWARFLAGADTRRGHAEEAR